MSGRDPGGRLREQGGTATVITIMSMAKKRALAAPFEATALLDCVEENISYEDPSR
jgi:hypothetical protein